MFHEHALFAALTEGQTRDSGYLYASQRSSLARLAYITFINLIQHISRTLNVQYLTNQSERIMKYI